MNLSDSIQRIVSYSKKSIEEVCTVRRNGAINYIASSLVGMGLMKLMGQIFMFVHIAVEHGSNEANGLNPQVCAHFTRAWRQ